MRHVLQNHYRRRRDSPPPLCRLKKAFPLPIPSSGKSFARGEKNRLPARGPRRRRLLAQSGIANADPCLPSCLHHKARSSPPFLSWDLEASSLERGDFFTTIGKTFREEDFVSLPKLLKAKLEKLPLDRGELMGPPHSPSREGSFPSLPQFWH